MSSPAVIWHELECGSYRADLELWDRLARLAAGDGRRARVLDVGAGTGRVACELARVGHRVTALELDPELMAALRRRAAGTGIATLCADARTFELPGVRFDLCLVAMQTIQLLGDRNERGAFLRRARAHLRGGGMLAVAIVTAFEPFDCAAGDPQPSAETARVGGVVYSSRATRVQLLGQRVLIQREREIYPDGRTGAPGSEVRSGHTDEEQRSVVELQRLDARQLEREACEFGLQPAFVTEIGPTDDHVGSSVVVLRA